MILDTIRPNHVELSIGQEAEKKDYFKYYAQYAPSLKQINCPEDAQRMLTVLEGLIAKMERVLLNAAKEVKGVWGEIDNIIITFQNIFKEKNIGYAMTKQFIDAAQTLQAAIVQAARLASNQPVPHAYKDYLEEIPKCLLRDPLQEAERISKKGTVLTHGARDAFMYEMLEDGVLASVSEQRIQFGRKRRTFTTDTRDSLDKETHGIVFEQDNTYRNLHSDGVVKEHETNIVLIFSENDLLSKGYLFNDCDGRFLYDPNYHSSAARPQGLSINLKEVARVFVVAQKEREKFINFLITKSAWRAELNALSPTDRSKWIDDNVFFIDSVGKVGKQTQQIKRKLVSGQKILNKKGFVELTNECPDNDTAGKERLKRFIPLAT